MKRVRRATDAERALWRAATKDATPLTSSLKRSVSTLAVSTEAEGTHAAPKPVQKHKHDPSKAQRPPQAPISAPMTAPMTGSFRPEPPATTSAKRTSFERSSHPVDPLRNPTPGLDRSTARALKRGKRSPDSRLDLHGMTLDRAHAALMRFIHAARVRGDRCVLVITGKGEAFRTGRGDDGMALYRPGALRRDVPHWLRTPPLNHSVTAIYQAHQRHGGEGAFYVYLRKPH